MVARYSVRRSQVYGAALTLKGAARLAGSLDLHFPWPLTRTRALIGVGGLKCVQITVPSIRRNGMAKPVTWPEVILATRLCPEKQPAPAMWRRALTTLDFGEVKRRDIPLCCLESRGVRYGPIQGLVKAGPWWAKVAMWARWVARP